MNGGVNGEIHFMPRMVNGEILIILFSTEEAYNLIELSWKVFRVVLLFLIEIMHRNNAVSQNLKHGFNACI